MTAQRTIEREPVSSAGVPRVSASEPGVLWIAVWCALASGLLEAAISWARSAGPHRLADRSPHFVWMIPAADLLFLALPALVLWAVARARPQWVSLKFSVFVFATPGFLALLLMYPRLHWAAALILAMGLAAQLAALASKHATGFARLVYRSVGVLAVIAAVSGGLVVARARSSEARWLANLPGARAGAPNVLFIILDTVRAASLSLYGYERKTTPELERLASQSVVFNSAVSTAPWTLPSHASIFTGRYPHELSTNWSTPLDATYPTLAEVMRDHGYYTAGFVANTGYCNTTTGLNRGFVHYEDFQVSLGEAVRSSTLGRFVGNNFRLRQIIGNDQHLDRQSAEDVSNRFLRALNRRGSRPFFAFLNYYDAHAPYLPESPYDRQFSNGRSTRKVSPLQRWSWDPSAGHREIEPKLLAEEIAAYDGSLAYLDHQLGLLFGDLRRRGLLDNTIVVVTADHGEEFGEHRVFDHGNSLYFASVHVPLIVSFGNRTPAGLRIAEPVSLRDLAATVLSLSGVADREKIPGESLTRFWNNPTSASESPILSEVRYARGHPDWFPVSKGDMSAVMRGYWRLIRDGDGRIELYNTASDPDELLDVANNAALLNEKAQLINLLQTKMNSTNASRSH